MSESIPGSDKCLTFDERRDLETAWAAMQVSAGFVGELVGRADEVDCDELHEAFLNLSNAFDKVEHLIMRSKQIRLIRTTHAGHTDR